MKKLTKKQLCQLCIDTMYNNNDTIEDVTQGRIKDFPVSQRTMNNIQKFGEGNASGSYSEPKFNSIRDVLKFYSINAIEKKSYFLR